MKNPFFFFIKLGRRPYGGDFNQAISLIKEGGIRFVRIPPIGFKPIYRWKVYDKRKPWPWLSFNRKSEPVGEKNLGFYFLG
jgi:hypothetical protein